MDTAANEIIGLPNWLEELLPEPTPPHVLTTELQGENRVLRVTAPTGESQTFSTVRDVDKARHGEGWDLAIDDDVYAHFGQGRSARRLTYEADREGYVGMLMAYSDRKRRASLERAYTGHLTGRSQYGTDRPDFVAAWNFIDGHPAFWTAYDLNEHPWHWETEGYGSKLRQHVHRNSEGQTVVQIEAGGHVPFATGPKSKPYSEHYGDWRLEVRAESFEDAILDLAFRVSRAFDIQGNSLEEEDFPYGAPLWVRELRERVSEED